MVVIDTKTDDRCEKMWQIRDELLEAVEEDRLQGRNGCTLDELTSFLDGVIAEISTDGES